MRPGKVFSWAALALFGLFLAAAVPRSLTQAARQMVDAVHTAGETPLDRRRRISGPEYIDAIEAIRRAIPPDGAYLLVNGATRDEGARLWVRFELAPRRAVLAGGRHGVRDPRRLLQKLPPDLPWAVVAHGRGGPPTLYGRAAFVARLEAGDAL